MTFEFIWELWLEAAEREVGKICKFDLPRVREYFDDGWTAIEFGNEVERMWYEHSTAY